MIRAFTSTISEISRIISNTKARAASARPRTSGAYEAKTSSMSLLGRLFFVGIGSRFRALFLSRPHFSLGGHRALLLALHALHKLHSSKPRPGPILINSHGANTFKSARTKNAPTVIAANLTLIFLGSSLGIRKPNHRIALSLLSDDFCESIHFSLLGDECQRKFTFTNFAQFAQNSNTAKPQQFRLKTLRRVQHHDLLLILKIHFFKSR